MKLTFTAAILLFAISLTGQVEQQNIIKEKLLAIEKRNPDKSFNSTINLLNESENSPENTTYMLKDSTYYFNYSDGWNATERSIALKRDKYAHVTNSISQTFDMNIWVNKDTTIRLYYSPDQEHKYLYKPWNSELQQWADTGNFVEFTENGKYLHYYYKGWSYYDNQFTYGFKYSFTFNKKGDYLQSIDYEYNADKSLWQLYEQWNYYYDTNDLLTHIIVLKWDSNSGQWINDTRRQYSYNMVGDQTEKLYQNWDSETEKWTNSTLTLTSYNEQGNDSLITTKTWQIGSEEWTNSSLRSYEFNLVGEMTKSLWQNWNYDSLNWINQTQRLYTYEWNTIRTEELYQSWDSYLHEWENSSKQLYLYDENDNKTQSISQNWNDFDQIWANSKKTEYYWTELVVDINEEQTETNISIYPNPSSEAITLLFENSNIESEVKIVSQAGKVVYTGTLENDKIDVSEFTPGVYFLILKSDNQQIVKKILKL